MCRRAQPQAPAVAESVATSSTAVSSTSSSSSIDAVAAAAAASVAGDDADEKFASTGSDDEVTVKDFELLKVIGKGGFGKVLKVRKRDSGKIYAMKVMDKSLFKNDKHLESLMAERDIMLNDCPFLVHLYFSFQVCIKRAN